MPPAPEKSNEHLCMIELSSRGYTDINHCMANYISNHPGFSAYVFRFSGSTTSKGHHPEYSAFDLFGERISYYILDCDEARREFSEFLVKKMKKNNKGRLSAGLKKAFTRILHQYNMHSELCYYCRPGEKSKNE
jgi:hypothetical protein